MKKRPEPTRGIPWPPHLAREKEALLQANEFAHRLVFLYDGYVHIWEHGRLVRLYTDGSREDVPAAELATERAIPERPPGPVTEPAFWHLSPRRPPASKTDRRAPMRKGTGEHKSSREGGG